jgi:hypothetical protein
MTAPQSTVSTAVVSTGAAGSPNRDSLSTIANYPKLVVQNQADRKINLSPPKGQLTFCILFQNTI